MWDRRSEDGHVFRLDRFAKKELRKHSICVTTGAKITVFFSGLWSVIFSMDVIKQAAVSCR